MGTGGKVRPGHAADHSPPSRAEVLEEYSYTSTPLWATTGPVTGLLYLYLYVGTRYSCQVLIKLEFSKKDFRKISQNQLL